MEKPVIRIDRFYNVTFVTYAVRCTAAYNPKFIKIRNSSMKRFFQLLLLSVSLFVTPALLAEVVNINKASAAALQENLKGIGEKKANAIVTYRKEYGAFKTLDEIMEVKGIGKGIFKKIKADISLNQGITDLVGAKSVKSAKPATKSAGKKAVKTTVKKSVVDKKAKPALQDKKAKQDAKSKKDKVKKS